MVKFRFAIFALLAFLYVAPAQTTNEVTLPKTFYKRMVGTINGRLPITANLTQLDSEFFGSYYYDSKKIPIEFSYDSRIQPDGKVLLKESYYEAKTGEWSNTGSFEGKFVSPTEIKGTWKSAKTGAKYDFELRESYPENFAGCEMLGDRKTWGDCGEAPCVELSYAYPVIAFSAEDESGKKLNDSFLEGAKTGLANMPGYNRDRNYKNLNEIMLDVAASYKEERGNFPEEEAPRWACHSRITLDYVFGDLVSFDSFIYQFSGGAHGMQNHLLNTVDMRTKKRVLLADALKPGYEKRLTDLGQKILRKNFGLGPKVKLSEAGFSFDDKKFFLPENYYFQPNGIKFKYLEYEVAPYAMGAPEILIPYTEIRDLIKPDGPLVND